MKKVIIFSGAGISAESGISTFRDSNGLWENHRIEDVCSADSLYKNRSLVIDFYNQRRTDIRDKKPNYAHLMVKNLQDRYPKNIEIITQNVDDLFERAGSKDVLHLHGFLRELRCESCSYIVDIGYEVQKDKGYECPHCCIDLRPNIVFFGESAPRYQDLYRALDECDMLVVIGTSGNVIDVNFLATHAKVAILNNLEYSSLIDENRFNKCLYKKATDAIDEIADDIEDFLK
jgi:NAD-dependent deacetylase